MTRAGPTIWAPVAAELDRWGEAGMTARLWLRDDDAVAATPALERLLGLCAVHGVVPLIAVIPFRLEPSLTARLVAGPPVAIAVHGAWHTNHAPPGRKAEEMAPERGVAAIAAELAEARARTVAAFGAAAGEWYVPPWNRIDRTVAALLPGLGFKRLSAFGTRAMLAHPELVETPTHVDLVDWKGGRRGRPAAWIASELARQLALARAEGRDTIGILAHHLAHDEVAWAGLAGVLDATAGHGHARWVVPTET